MEHRTPCALVVVVALMSVASGLIAGLGPRSPHASASSVPPATQTTGSGTGLASLPALPPKAVAPVAPLQNPDPAALGQLESPVGPYATVPTGGQPIGVAYDAANHDVFVTNSASNNVSVISDLTGAEVASVRVGTAPAGIAYDAAMGELFVANFASGTVSVINGTTDTVVATVHVGTDPTGVAFDPGLSQVFVTNYGSANMSVISASTDTVLGSVGSAADPLTNPSAVLYDSGENEVWIAEPTYGVGTFYPVAGFKGTGHASYDGWGYIDAFAYDSVNAELFYAHYNTDDVTVMTDVPDDNQLVATVPVGAEPMGEVCDTGTGEVFVANYASNNVSEISAATDHVVGTFPVGLGPQGVTYDPANGEVFVADRGSDTVSILGGYNVTFKESGLPLGTEWFVNLTGGPSFSSTTETVHFLEPRGSYLFRTATTNKDYAAGGGSFLVNTTAVSRSVPFVLQTFPVSFLETGLPSKTLAKDGWTAVLNGAGGLHRTTSVSFTAEANGTYPVLVSGPSGYTESEAGTFVNDVTVKGATTVSVAFAPGKTLTLTVKEKGLPKGQSWCVALLGAQECSESSSLRYENLTSGTYRGAVLSPLAGQTITGELGQIKASLTGGVSVTWDLLSSSKIDLTFTYRYPVTFTETGLSGNGSWSVTIKGSTLSNTTTRPIVFHLTNGTYASKIGPISGYTSVVTPKKAVVNGKAVTLTVTFTAKKKKSGTPVLPPGLTAASLGLATRRPGP